VRELEDTARRLALRLQAVTQAGEARTGDRVQASDGRDALAAIAKIRDTRQLILGDNACRSRRGNADRAHACVAGEQVVCP
jgi:hypothetical protein